MTAFWIAFGLFCLLTAGCSILLLAVGLLTSAMRSAEDERDEHDAQMWADLVEAFGERS